MNQTDINIEGTGRTICLKGMGWRSGLMDKIMQEPLDRAKNKDKEGTKIPSKISMREHFGTDPIMDRVKWFGKTGKHILVIGNRIR